jgi:hypothetical protein
MSRHRHAARCLAHSVGISKLTVISAGAFMGIALIPLSVMAQDDPSALLRSMAGTWTVEQRMWAAPGAEATSLPAAIAERRLVDGKFLEESMSPVGLAPGSPGFFTRTAVFNYNSVNKKYEYFSIDTRAPQAMNETGPTFSRAVGPSEIRLSGGTFVAPEWGPAKNVRFKYRLTIGAVDDNRQVVKLYLTPQSGVPPKEFTGFEYVYVRSP